MADEDSSQEKTEEATTRRLEKAREDGQVPRSRELTTTAVLLAGSIGLLFFGGFIAQNLLQILELNFSLSREAIYDPQYMFNHLGQSFNKALWALVPFFVTVLIAALAGPVALGGWLMSGKALAPKLNRISPIAGLKRMFSVKSLVELVKAIGKVLIVVAAAYFLLLAMKESILGLSFEGLQRGVRHSLYLSAWAAVIMSAATILIVVMDVPFQIWDHAKKLKMSRQEIKDEMKDTEGKPEVKSKIRMLQQQMAQKRMISMVPDADVIITNPTHFSCALKYNPETMETPILLAKGVDHMALKIREVAKMHKIEFVEAPVLARAIYHTTEVDQAIPRGLYIAVAQVLAYVFQLRAFRKGGGERPDYPKKLDIPPDMRY